MTAENRVRFSVGGHAGGRESEGARQCRRRGEEGNCRGEAGGENYLCSQGTLLALTSWINFLEGKEGKKIKGKTQQVAQG